MYTRRTIAPLTINTRPETEGKPGVFSAAAFHYTEESVDANSRRLSVLNRPGSRQAAAERTSPRRQRSTQQSASMTNFQATPISSPAMYVRALYNYDADDRTSLSFREGDIIQVITQLESGWWDGIINGVRGWFPSNYCQVVPSANDREGEQVGPSDVSGDSGTDDDPGDVDQTGRAAGVRGRAESRQNSSSLEQEQETAAFWVPQATQDGRLYYYNTLTGVSRMELPLETPTSANETGPLDRMNVRAPDQTRPPPEMMMSGRDEDEASASELEGDSMINSISSLPRRRRSYMSEGVSPAASMESLSSSPMTRSREDPRELHRPPQVSNPGTNATSYAENLLGQYVNTKVPRAFFDGGNSSPVTWNRLMENMRKSVESYRQAINNADRSEYVRKAEDISDHLRMLLAAGSGTTDNHSGNPSVISTNKALYPHFRDMMSKFSKLVLSSHIAASDWPAADSYSKCLQEAEGVLQGVYGFVEVARAQRGEDIQRLLPGFVLGRHAGGSWQNNNLMPRDPALSSFVDQDEEAYNEPSLKLESQLLERMDDLKRMIVSSIRRLEEHLIVTNKIVTPVRHEQISNSICTGAGKVIDYLRPYISTLESINLAQVSPSVQGIDLGDFATQKQRLYDLVASLVVACQTVAGPLSDEWADIRGEPLVERVQGVQNITKQLETSMSQIGFFLQTLLRESPSDALSSQVRNPQRRTEPDLAKNMNHIRTASKGGFQRPQLADVGQSTSFTQGVEPTTDSYSNNPKLKKFFGEVPTSVPTGRESEEIPSFLKLDHEGEISYDKKVDPPQLRGGTLIALVEQLTRHDRLDAPFNNTFLLTYRSFTTASELFEMLVKRFSLQPPRGINQDDYRTWVDKKQKPIRFRVVNILKSWFDTFWMEGNDDTSNELLRRVYSFAKDSVATSSTPGSGPLMTVVEQRLRGLDSTSSKRLVLNLSTQAPAPIIPKNMKKLKFLDIDVTEFARQLTIIESKLYGKIKPTECLNKTWQKKFNLEKEPDPAPNVKALILHSNQLTNWVAEMILTQSDVKKRVVVIKHFVSVADVSNGIWF